MPSAGHEVLLGEAVLRDLERIGGRGGRGTRAARNAAVAAGTFSNS